MITKANEEAGIAIVERERDFRMMSQAVEDFEQLGSQPRPLEELGPSSPEVVVSVEAVENMRSRLVAALI